MTARRLYPPSDWWLLPDGQRKLGEAVSQAINGKVNSTGTVTLTAGAATTAVTNNLVTIDSVILFAPQTANADAIATPYVKPADITQGSGFTITHANDANVDKTFAYVILG